MVLQHSKVKTSIFFFLPQYNFNNRGSLTFEPLTLVPIQTKMIDVDSLTDKEVMGKSWWAGMLLGEMETTLNSSNPFSKS